MDHCGSQKDRHCLLFVFGGLENRKHLGSFTFCESLMTLSSHHRRMRGPKEALSTAVTTGENFNTPSDP
jgi:hypothetical protein